MHKNIEGIRQSEDGDNVGSQRNDVVAFIVKVQLYVREESYVISKLLSLSKKKAGPSDEACEDENSKFVGTICCG